MARNIPKGIKTSDLETDVLITALQFLIVDLEHLREFHQNDMKIQEKIKARKYLKIAKSLKRDIIEFKNGDC